MKKLFTICLISLSVGLIQAQTTLFSENFDSYTAGQNVNDNQPLIFPWTGATAEKAKISDVKSYSPSNAMKIVNDNDMVYDFGGKTSGKYQVNFWMLVDSAAGGYFNIEHAFGSSWAFAFYFKPAGTCDLKEGGQTHTFNYTTNTWMQIELYFNLEVDSVTATVDGTQIASWKFSNEEDAAGGENKLDVINFYGLHETSTGVTSSSYFIDDFEYIEIESGLLPPTISINTTPIISTTAANETITFGNTGEETMNFSAYPTFINPSVSSNLVDGVMKYDGGSASAIGWASSFEVYAATRFLPDMTRTKLGQQITSVSIFINDAPVGDSIRVYIWEKGEYAIPGTTTVLAEKAYSAFAQMDNTITLDNPVTITGDELWIGYKFTTPANGFTLGTDTNATVPHTSFLKTGPVWSEFDGVGGNMQGNFAIRANVTGAGWPVWLNVAPASGTLAPAGSQNLTLSFNTTGLASGTYEADVVVGCNDPANEWSEVHVTLTHTAGIDDNSSISVMTYPNPVADFYNIVSNNTISKVNVYSIDGKMVKSLLPDSKNVTVNVSDLSKGSYIMEITSGNTTSTRNVIIK